MVCTITASQQAASDSAANKAIDASKTTGTSKKLEALAAHTQMVMSGAKSVPTKKHDLINFFLGKGLVGQEVVDAMTAKGFKIKLADVNANIKHYGTTQLPGGFPKYTLAGAKTEYQKALEGASAQEKFAVQPGDAEILAKPASEYKAVNDEADTSKRFTDTYGTWTPERQQLHDAIVRKYLAAAKPSAAPTIRMLGGGPAAGKSVLIQAQGVSDSMVHVDPDEIKKLLPEWAVGVAAKDKMVATMVHEESSLLAKRLIKEAIDSHFDILIDGTGDNSYENLAKKVISYKDAGYKLSADYVTVDTEEAIRRAAERAKVTGRNVPEAYLREVHRNISAIFPRAIEEGLFPNATLWDTNDATKKIAEIVDKKLTILDEPAWQRFLAKAQDQNEVLNNAFPSFHGGQISTVLGGPHLPADKLYNYLGAYGKEWEAAPLPPGFTKMTAKECYANATRLVLDHPELRYVEGIAQSDATGNLTFMHAWAVDPAGRVIDPTWEHPEKGRYFGVVYDSDALRKHLLKTKVYGVLSGDTKAALEIMKSDSMRWQPAPVLPPKPAADTEAYIMHKQVAPQAGSNPGGFYEDADGNQRYVKLYADSGQGVGELVSNAIYRRLGLTAPESQLFKRADGKLGYSHKIIDGVGTVDKVGLTKEVADKVLDGFAADVLLANWDVAGQTLDNLLVLKDGGVARLDQGGSLLYRAKGKLKGLSVMSGLTEWENFAPGGSNASYGKIFNTAGFANAAAMGDRVLTQIEGIKQFRAGLGTGGYEQFIKNLGVNAKTAQQLGDILQMRTEKLIQKAESIKKEIKAAEEAKKLFAEMETQGIVFKKIPTAQLPAIPATSPVINAASSYETEAVLVSKPPQEILASGAEAAARWYLKHIPQMTVQHINYAINRLLGQSINTGTLEALKAESVTGIPMLKLSPPQPGFIHEQYSKIDAQNRGLDGRITPESNSALQSYGGNGYGAINDALRSKQLSGRGAVPTKVRAIDLVMNKSTLGVNSVLYRGVGNSHPFNTMSAVELQRAIGTEFTELGYGSYSASFQKATSFSAGRVMIRMHAPADIHGVWMRSAHVGLASEYEFLMHRETKTLIKAVSLEDSYIVVDVELLEQGALKNALPEPTLKELGHNAIQDALTKKYGGTLPYNGPSGKPYEEWVKAQYAANSAELEAIHAGGSVAPIEALQAAITPLKQQSEALQNEVGKVTWTGWEYDSSLAAYNASGSKLSAVEWSSKVNWLTELSSQLSKLNGDLAYLKQHATTHLPGGTGEYPKGGILSLKEKNLGKLMKKADGTINDSVGAYYKSKSPLTYAKWKDAVAEKGASVMAAHVAHDVKPVPGHIKGKHELINYYLTQGLDGQAVVDVVNANGYKIKLADVNANKKHYGTAKLPGKNKKASEVLKEAQLSTMKQVPNTLNIESVVADLEQKILTTTDMFTDKKEMLKVFASYKKNVGGTYKTWLEKVYSKLQHSEVADALDKMGIPAQAFNPEQHKAELNTLMTYKDVNEQVLKQEYYDQAKLDGETTFEQWVHDAVSALPDAPTQLILTPGLKDMGIKEEDLPALSQVTVAQMEAKVKKYIQKNGMYSDLKTAYENSKTVPKPSYDEWLKGYYKFAQEGFPL